MKYTFPIDTYGKNCVLVPIDEALIPLVAGALNRFFLESIWITRADYELGYNAFAELLANMTNNCLQELVDGQDRIYRLLDTALNGTQYSSSANPADPDRPLISPALPAVPPVSTSSPNALRAHVGRLWKIAENVATGAIYPPSEGVLGAPALDDDQSERETLRAAQGLLNSGWFNGPARAATYADIVAAVRVGDDNQVQRVTTALDVLGGAGSAASIVGTVKDFFAQGADVTLDGLMLATMIVSTMAQTATAGLQAGQLSELNTKLTRIIGDLDGGGDDEPSDNVLQALRGNNPASATRNVIDSGGNTAQLEAKILELKAELDEVEELLQAIKEQTE